MVFVREIRKGGKTYKYLYKSKRVNGKVRSIYVGKEEVKNRHASKKSNYAKHKNYRKVNKKSNSKSNIVRHIRKDDKWIVDKIVEFNKLMEESMDLIIKNRIEAAANHYNKLLGIYNQLSEHVGDEEKIKLYDKTKQIYDRIQEFGLE